MNQFLSTSPLRGTTPARYKSTLPPPISIHVPLAGDDWSKMSSSSSSSDFYPRPPCGGRRTGIVPKNAIGINFYPRPPCGGRQMRLITSRRPHNFYPRPPCGGRHWRSWFCPSRTHFYPRPPCGGRRHFLFGRPRQGYFYPRPPCGGRHWCALAEFCRREFLSTSPLRGTTVVYNCQITLCQISIHVPLAGDDRTSSAVMPVRSTFLSTSPLRGTTLLPCLQTRFRPHFYPRPPCGGRRR